MSNTAGARCGSSRSSGTSWQAQLVLGALPERASFPGPRVELMFAPVESLPFSVDLSLNARYLPNELALRIARRKIQDADQILQGRVRRRAGRLRPGLRTHPAGARSALLPAVLEPPAAAARDARGRGSAAASERELEERVEMCRRAYGEIRLHRPLGDQLELFCQQLPGAAHRASPATTTRSPPSRSRR